MLIKGIAMNKTNFIIVEIIVSNVILHFYVKGFDNCRANKEGYSRNLIGLFTRVY
jgi:hypothetical protein